MQGIAPKLNIFYIYLVFRISEALKLPNSLS